MKYFAIVSMISVFVLLYVWQNIEMMRLKMDYRKLASIEKTVSEENKRLILSIERERNIDKVEANLSGKALRRILPQDVLVVKDKDKNKDEDYEVK
ncbi:MAG TPA: hypothetical protein PKX79_09870 [Spirochaetota bacterium]|jgi:hypothetical protein|nr:hypothetical protein [Spirochaetota bacterium]OQA98368.1 MAG: hypothetical protein BWY23_01144 [Spirochaetes bacterium ADurb.Bin218]HOK02898.1 hypothetical protein [Spirochaetota bacterium]HOK93098.1 hypothetical protein [Spirochaetota bacterium]HON16017.1 hypothetical protein [Spirochaetota bacterium]